MKTNFRNPPIKEITVSRGEIWIKRVDAIVGAVVLVLGGFAVTAILAAWILRS